MLPQVYTTRSELLFTNLVWQTQDGRRHRGWPRVPSADRNEVVCCLDNISIDLGLSLLETWEATVLPLARGKHNPRHES